MNLMDVIDYDQYTQKFYQVVSLFKIQNIPDPILLALKQYEFILIEAGKQGNFIEKRICFGCKGWCNPNASIVSCIDCLSIYHLHCARLSREPKKGYAWECVDCLSKHSPPPTLDGSVVENRLSSDENDPSECSLENANYEMDPESFKLIQSHLKKTARFKLPFPFRYFGEYSKFEDLLTDTEGRPKASSRIGRSYQATQIPDCIVGDSGDISLLESPSNTTNNTIKKRDRRKKNSLTENGKYFYVMII